MSTLSMRCSYIVAASRVGREGVRSCLGVGLGEGKTTKDFPAGLRYLHRSEIARERCSSEALFDGYRYREAAPRRGGGGGRSFTSSGLGGVGNRARVNSSSSIIHQQTSQPPLHLAPTPGTTPYSTFCTCTSSPISRWPLSSLERPRRVAQATRSRAPPQLSPLVRGSTVSTR